MISAAELDDLRADAEREMPDRISVFRLDRDDLNPVSLVATPVYTTLATDLPAFVNRASTGPGRSMQQGERPLEMDTFAVHTRVSYIDFQAGDIIVATTSYDPMPFQLKVLAFAAGSTTGARRITCERIGEGITLPVVTILPTPED